MKSYPESKASKKLQRFSELKHLKIWSTTKMFYTRVIEWTWELQIETLCLGFVYGTRIIAIKKKSRFNEIKIIATITKYCAKYLYTFFLRLTMK